MIKIKLKFPETKKEFLEQNKKELDKIFNAKDKEEFYVENEFSKHLEYFDYFFNDLKDTTCSNYKALFNPYTGGRLNELEVFEEFIIDVIYDQFKYGERHSYNVDVFTYVDIDRQIHFATYIPEKLLVKTYGEEFIDPDKTSISNFFELGVKNIVELTLRDYYDFRRDNPKTLIDIYKYDIGLK